MTAAPAPLRGLYAITSADLCRAPADLARAVELALRGGAHLVQYRDKESAPAVRAANARTLLALCRAHGGRLIINDDVDLADAVGADGVHLGATDLPLREARRRLPAALIGVSCGNVLARAHSAQDGGADYVAFGRFFESRTKPDAPAATLDLLRMARAQLRVAICAIGGLTPQNAAPVVAAGADLIAAVDGIFGVRDIAAAAGDYARLFVE